MKLHYFNQPAPDADDLQLQMAIQQGYVPATCRLGGAVVMDEVRASRDACAGCSCDRTVCHGRPKRQEQPKPSPAPIEDWTRLGLEETATGLTVINRRKCAKNIDLEQP